ncbi:MAG: hydroxymethylglutaryl-CoA lyase [Sphingomonadaceae bacterium]
MKGRREGALLVQERQPERSGVAIVEVSPRDGLQNESVLIPTEKKIGLIRRAIALGARRIEVTSFVHPDRVPQMADAEAVIEALPDEAGVVYIGLVLNKRGALRALATKVHELGAVCVATDSFAQRNQGQTARESLDAACEIVRLARDAGRSAQITIGASFGCPFEGEVSAAHVVDMAKRAADAQPREIAIADTIGVGVPAQVADLIGALREAVYPLPIRGHFHNTRGSGVANVWAAVQAGAQAIDASLGGIGGCPFAPSAAGNVATEDVAYLFERSGISTGIDLGKAIESVTWLSEVMGRRLPGMVSRAGGFPSAA